MIALTRDGVRGSSSLSLWERVGVRGRRITPDSRILLSCVAWAFRPSQASGRSHHPAGLGPEGSKVDRGRPQSGEEGIPTRERGNEGFHDAQTQEGAGDPQAMRRVPAGTALQAPFALPPPTFSQ